ncbi:hypothetical protein [Phycobacter sp. K97]|uniref:hypothetical protein n=1 Tax=Phycobacter sedimenti TaxID=3133977 RepID=UPI00311E9F34
MSNTHDDSGMSPATNLTGGPVSHGAGFELACCQVGASANAVWVSAAELIYELTGEPGKVVRNTITFDVEGTTIDVDLLNGAFAVKKEGSGTPIEGRKAIDLLMKWKGYDFDQAIEYVIENYSMDHAMAMAKDFGAMKVQMLSDRMAAKKGD